MREEKTCVCCNISQPRANFFKKGSKYDQRDSHCKECRSIKGKEDYKKYEKNYYLLKGYKITLEQYNILFIKQNGCCAICGRHQSEFKKALTVDHNHITGVVRGLLCIKCNLGIGSFCDNIELLDNAKKYLNNGVL